MMNITVDRSSGIVRMQLSGFWSHDNFEGFKREVIKAVANLGIAPGEHMILIDLREATLQTQALISDAQAFMAGAENKARRVAFVVASALSRMQTKRLAIRPGIALFETIENAEKWLFDEAMEV